MRYSGLRFFNGTKSEIELSYDSVNEVFEGSIHLNEVSTGLYETATIFVLEEAVSQFGAEKLVKPIGSTIGSKFKCEFVKDKKMSADINLISAYLGEDNEMYVKTESTIELEVQDNSVAVSTTDGIHTLGSSYSKEALQFTIALNSEDDKSHYRYLRIYDTIDDKLVANIYVYGETVGEDERLAVLLSNFGTSLSTKDQFLFKDHDINELGTDWQLINRKRKELLLELANIKPFVGTYKALINAIKFFGYNNLTLKEYWLMIDDRSPMFGKMKALEVPFNSDGFAAKKRETLLPSSSYKKTSRFGLFYKLNEPTGDFDEWDTPQVEEIFDFTPDEVLIKLYGLKNKLQKEYLPLHARIIDIIGEADFYSSYNTNIWTSQNPISLITAGTEASINIHQDNIYIEDLEKVSDLLEGKSQSFDNLSDQDIIDLYSDVETFYQTYYDIDRNTFRSDDTDSRIGAPIMLECTSFNETWDDAQFTWLDAGQAEVTFDNWWKQDIYELRWYITGPKNFSATLIGNVDVYRKVAIALPYEGTYSVKFEQVDLFNNVMVLRYPNAITVRTKPVEFYGLYRWKEDQDIVWGKSSYDWKNAGGDWEFPQQNKDDVETEIATLYMTLDRANYLHDESNGINFSMVRKYKDLGSSTGYSETTGPYFWRNLSKHSWNNGKHTWWDATHVGADQSASFLIKSARAGVTMTIEHLDVDSNTVLSGDYTFTLTVSNPTDITSWQAEVADLNASTDPIISKFNYNGIFEDTNNTGNVDECLGILAVAKQYSTSYDFDSVTFDIPADGLIENEIHYKSNNPTYNDVRIARDHVTIEKLTHMTFSADNSKMPGKTAYTWKITNNSTNEDDIYYNNKWLTYLFEYNGDYTIELEVTDINGNTNKVKKNALTIK
jgi:hypothetical protein